MKIAFFVSIGVAMAVFLFVYMILTIQQYDTKHANDPFDNYTEFRTPSGVLCVQTRTNLACDFSGAEK